MSRLSNRHQEELRVAVANRGWRRRLLRRNNKCLSCRFVRYLQNCVIGISFRDDCHSSILLIPLLHLHHQLHPTHLSLSLYIDPSRSPCLRGRCASSSHSPRASIIHHPDTSNAASFSLIALTSHLLVDYSLSLSLSDRYIATIARHACHIHLSILYITYAPLEPLFAATHLSTASPPLHPSFRAFL